MSQAAIRARLVSHTHWDREWYQTFQGFRARLVDCIDRVLELVDRDPGFCFLLDGQTAVLEDYLEIRPERRDELAQAIRRGRVAIGPWYVQPDSLVPSGEAHVRNLLEGRRVGAALGPVSSVAYTPDSFGHPAQFPQLFAGFGLGPFVYWRGNGNEIDALPSEYAWIAPDGSRVVACNLARGYFGAAMLPRDLAHATKRTRELAEALAQRTRQGRVILMNGIDHSPPDPRTAELVAALANETGWQVERGLLDGFWDGLEEPLPEHRGELVGARIAHLLPGVWSTRSALKLRNRRCEAALELLTEPWCALAGCLGLASERPALRLAWRALLRNQAHDSIGGCSVDLVHEQMAARYDEAEELAFQTRRRVQERLAGLGPERRIPHDETLALAVFNPSPYPRSDLARFALDPLPAFTAGEHHAEYHPLLAADPAQLGFVCDGAPVRVVPADATGRYLLTPDRGAFDLELLARDVPAFGWRRLLLSRAERSDDVIDAGREIDAGETHVRVEDAGTLCVRIRGREWRGLCALEQVGDRGDSYDFDPVGEPGCRIERVEVSRRRHPGGIASLCVERELRLPCGLAEDRESRSSDTTLLRVGLEARLIPGVERVDLRVWLSNSARDFRLRLLFPSGAPVSEFRAATTFDVARRRPGRADDSGWIHPAPATFPQQGFVSANELCVVAPGLCEAELDADGRIAITLLRAVGWLSRHDLRTRQGPAGPALATPGAQCPGRFEARLWLLCGAELFRAREPEAPLCAVAAGSAPLLEPDRALLEVEPREVVISALKPAEHGDGAVLRLLNPTDAPLRARVRLGFEIGSATSVRLDETPCNQPLSRSGRTLELELPPHALRTILLAR